MLRRLREHWRPIVAIFAFWAISGALLAVSAFVHDFYPFSPFTAVAWILFLIAASIICFGIGALFLKEWLFE